jgi:hypothetical protein
MSPDAFEAFDEPIDIDTECEDVRKLLLGDDLSDKSPDAIEPILDI